MKTQFIIFCSLIAIFSAAQAQAPAPAAFEIKNIGRGTSSQVYIEQAWKRNAPVIEVDLRTNEDLQGKKPFVKAYFYDKDKKLIVKADEPSQYVQPGKGMTKIPDYLKPKETYKVCFGISTQALDLRRKWTRVLVVFGEGNRAVAEVYPPDDAALFDFDEKAFATVKRK
jgi:hypothetical protein